MNKRKKKKWTTKNTHAKRITRSSDIDPVKWYHRVTAWIIIAIAILIILIVAFNNHIVGYDNYIGIPIEWARSLFD